MRSVLVLSTISVLATLLIAACGGDDGKPSDSNPAQSLDPNAPSTTAHGEMTVTVAINGTGSVRSEPAGIDCPAGNCSAAFAPGTKVTLIATGAEGWRVASWDGTPPASASWCSQNRCELAMDRPLTITSTYKLIDPPWDPSVGGKDCADAWGRDGERLSPCDTQKDDYVVVNKTKRNVALCKNGALVKNIYGALGFAPTGDKEKEGDGKTPEGIFYVPRLLPQSSYYKAFLFSYPTPEDADRGMASGLITLNQKKAIESSHKACTEPLQTTNLGGEIEIHGADPKKSAVPRGTDWTAGCIAVDNSDIDLLWQSIGVGDTVVVLP